MELSPEEKKYRMIALSKKEQLESMLRDSEKDIDRIIENGPSDDEDIALIKRCLLYISGNIKMSRDDLSSLE